MSGVTELKPNEPEAWGLAEVGLATYLVSARQRDSEDGLSTFLIHIMIRGEVLDTPIATFKMNCGMYYNRQRNAVRKIAELLAAEDFTPWDLRDAEYEFIEFIRREPSRSIHGRL